MHVSWALCQQNYTASLEIKFLGSFFVPRLNKWWHHLPKVPAELCLFSLLISHTELQTLSSKQNLNLTSRSKRMTLSTRSHQLLHSDFFSKAPTLSWPIQSGSHLHNHPILHHSLPKPPAAQVQPNWSPSCSTTKPSTAYTKGFAFPLLFPLWISHPTHPTPRFLLHSGRYRKSVTLSPFPAFPHFLSPVLSPALIFFIAFMITWNYIFYLAYLLALFITTHIVSTHQDPGF